VLQWFQVYATERSLFINRSSHPAANGLTYLYLTYVHFFNRLRKLKEAKTVDVLSWDSSATMYPRLLKTLELCALEKKEQESPASPFTTRVPPSIVSVRLFYQIVGSKDASLKNCLTNFAALSFLNFVFTVPNFMIQGGDFTQGKPYLPYLLGLVLTIMGISV